MEEKYRVTTRDEQFDIYKMLDGLVERHHDHLVNSEIRVAMFTGWQADEDGRLTLGRCKIVSELDRKLHGAHVVIVLNADAWEHFSEPQRLALLDHELCHAEVKLDKDLEPMELEDETPKLRSRKHDIEEFRAVIERHGIWKDDLQSFAEAVLEAQGRLPFSEEEQPKRRKAAAG
jgi:hypothetical protein